MYHHSDTDPSVCGVYDFIRNLRLCQSEGSHIEAPARLPQHPEQLLHGVLRREEETGGAKGAVHAYPD